VQIKKDPENMLKCGRTCGVVGTAGRLPSVVVLQVLDQILCSVVCPWMKENGRMVVEFPR